MSNYEISGLITLLQEAKAAFIPVEQRGINTAWIQSLEKKIDEQIRKLSQTPGYQRHLKINSLLEKMEQKGLISLDTLTQLYDNQAHELQANRISE